MRSVYTYDAADLLISETHGLPGVVTEYVYNPSGTLSQMSTYLAGELTNHYEYEYDLLGNRTCKDENGEVTRYYYDALSRLRIARMPGNHYQIYEYDDYGNIEKLAEIETAKSPKRCITMTGPDALY
jgi:YD repeat-containing protein